MISPISSVGVLSARHALQRTQSDQSNIFTRLATGKRINKGADGPAALISSEQLAAEITALEAETKSLRRQDSNARITEGHSVELSSLMNDLQGLVVSSANQAGMSDAEIQANQLQIDSIVTSIQRFTGDAVSSLDTITMPGTGNTDVAALLTGASTSVASLASGGANSMSSGNFDAAQQAVSAAIQGVATARGKIGAFQKYTVEPRFNSNRIAIENVTASKSIISDADYAVEMSNLLRTQILTASGIKVLKISQQQAASVLSLFK